MTELLVLEWGREVLRGLNVDSADASLRVQGSFDVSWPEEFRSNRNPQLAANWLKSVLDQQGVGAQQVVVLLPGEDVVMRCLQLPETAKESLTQVVRYQAGAKSAIGLDQIEIDYLPIPSAESQAECRVLAVTTRRQLLREIESTIQMADLTLESIGVSNVAAAEMIRRAERTMHDIAPCSVALTFWDDDLVIYLLQSGNLIASQIASGLRPNDLNAVRAQVQRLLLANVQVIGDDPISQIWLCGIPEIQSGDVDFLADALGSQVASLDPSAERTRQLDTGALPSGWSKFTPLIGALLERLDKQPTIDLLSPRKTITTPNNTKRNVACAAALALALMAPVFVGGRVYTASLAGRIAAKQHEKTEREAVLTREQPTLQMSEFLADWQARRINWLDQMHRIVNVMPGTDRLYVEKVRFSPGAGEIVATIQANGLARERFTVEDLNQQLDNFPDLRIRPKEIESPQGQDQYPVRFEIDADLLLP